MKIRTYIKTLAYSITNAEKLTLIINSKDISVEIEEGSTGIMIVFRDIDSTELIAMIHECQDEDSDYYNEWCDNEMEVF